MAELFDRPSRWMDEELVMFDGSVSHFLADKAPPERLQKWREDGIVERSAWDEMAQAGLLGLSIAPEYGGAGGDFRHEAVLIRRLGLAGAEGWAFRCITQFAVPQAHHSRDQRPGGRHRRDNDPANGHPPSE